MIPESGLTIIIKACGSAIGSAIALVFDPPRSRLGAARRVLVAFPIGILFSWVPGLFVEVPNTYEGTAASSLTMAVVAWWLVGAARRVIDVRSSRDYIARSETQPFPKEKDTSKTRENS